VRIKGLLLVEEEKQAGTPTLCKLIELLVVSNSPGLQYAVRELVISA
jgi:hypothetical protein